MLDEDKSDQTDKEEGISRDSSRSSNERKYCKYKQGVKALNFCHDFQNNFCPRPKCKFIHCTADEVDDYKRSGKMSNQILAEATRKSQLPGMQPICIQFRNGNCRRNNCKYRHLTKEEEEAEILELIQRNSIQQTQYLQQDLHSLQLPINVSMMQNDFAFCPPFRKRRLIDESTDSNRNEHIFKGYCAGSPPAPILNSADARSLVLEEEISLLHKEINQLKRQVQDLTATNEFLLDQNANLRVSNGAVSNNTLTNSTSQASQQVIRTMTTGVANVPVSLATVPVSLATVPVSLATVPVSLTSVSTCNPVSISAVPSVSIATPSAQLLASSQQYLVTTNPSNQIAITANNLTGSNGQQLTVTNVPQQLTLSQTPQQISITNQNPQQLTLSQTPQQISITNQNPPQLTLSQTPQQITLANQSQPQLALTSQNQQILTQQNLTAPQQIIEHRTIQTSQPIAMSNAPQTMVSYPIVTHSINHAIH